MLNITSCKGTEIILENFMLKKPIKPKKIKFKTFHIGVKTVKREDIDSCTAFFTSRIDTERILNVIHQNSNKVCRECKIYTEEMDIELAQAITTYLKGEALGLEKKE